MENTMSVRKVGWSLTLLSAGSLAGLLVAAEPKPIPADQFEKLHKMIMPQPGENRFHEIPWLLSIDEARRQAAAVGKPILVWSGAGGPPIGAC
jgi:hypothetical protein